MGAKAHGKRYRAAAEKVSEDALPLVEAIDALRQLGAAKFDQTVEIVIWLGIDPKQSDQQIRGSISLPNGIGKTKKVVVFCDDAQVDAAKEAGAIEAGGDELVEKIQKGWMDFDVAVAQPAMMRSVSKLGRLLGPQGKMPSPKAGTVVDDVVTAVKEYSAGKIEFRNDDGGNIHAPIGKLSFETPALVGNADALLSRIRSMKPPACKGQYLRKACLSATMSPSVRLALE